MYQLMLFKDMLPEYINPAQTDEDVNRFQVCKIDDIDHRFTIDIEEGQDPESVALEKLGYFVVPQSNLIV